jgi:hypothetical protein
MLTPEEQSELQRLLREHIPIRAIARRLNRDVKTIRRALGRSRAPSPAAPSKLAPYHELITERAQQGLRHHAGAGRGHAPLAPHLPGLRHALGFRALRRPPRYEVSRRLPLMSIGSQERRPRERVCERVFRN